MIRQIILATLCIFIICVGEINGQDDEKVRCEASALRMGGEGEITCRSPKDLDQQNAMAITIWHSDTIVLECMWYKKLHCPESRPGYITEVAGRTLKVMFPNVTEADLGEYRCTMMDNNPIEGEYCPFLINGTIPTSPRPSSIMTELISGSIPATPPPSTTEVYRDQTTSRNNSSSSNPHVGLIVGPVFAALVVVILVILVFVFVWYRRNRRRKRCHRDLEAPAEEGTDEEQDMALLPDGQGPDQNGIDGTPVLNSSGVQENTGDMQGNNEQNETLDQQEANPAADRCVVLPAIHSTTDSDVDDAEETLEDLASAPSAADMSGAVSGNPEDKTATTGEEEMLKYIYSRGWESVVNLGSKAIQYGKTLTPLYGGDNTKAEVPTDSREDTNSHLESSTDVPPVASDVTESGTGVPDDEGSTADGTEEETSDTGKDEAALTEPVTPEDKGAETREETISWGQSYRGGSNRPTSGGEGTGRGAARSSGQRSARHGDDGVKPSLTTGADASTSPLLGDGIASDPHHSTKRGSEEEGLKSHGVGALTSMFEQRGQQDSTATVSRDNDGGGRRRGGAARYSNNV